MPKPKLSKKIEKMGFKSLSKKHLLILGMIAVIVATAFVVSKFMQAETRAYSPYGVASHFMWDSYTDADINTELDQAQAAGAKWIRFDVGWSATEEQAKGTYWRMTRLTNIINGIKSRGMEPVPAVMGTPAWANNNAGMWTPPTNDQDFYDYMKYITARFNTVRYWEIWNEPNLPEFWQPAPDAARYTKLLQAGYRGLKAGNPNALVISGGLSNNDKEYLQQMYNAGARGYFDLFGLHPYTENRSPYYTCHSYDHEWNFCGITDMKQTMEANGDTGKHIFVTETGWTTSKVSWGVTESQQAQFLTEAYNRILTEFPYVDALVIYNLRNRGTDPNSTVANDNFGIIRKDFTHKPAYDAFSNGAHNWAAGVPVAPPADTQAPAVSITSPASNSTVSGNMTVSVTASDNVGTSKVEIYIDNSLKSTQTAAPYSYGFDSKTIPNGSHTILAKGYDAAGNVGTSTVITVNVLNNTDTTAPTISFIAPKDGQNITERRVAIEADAKDNVGITKINLYIDDRLISTTTAPNIYYIWNTRRLHGSHTLKAQAFDVAGNKGETTITVYK